MSPVIKRRGDKFTIPGKYLLFILTVLCISLITVTYKTNIFSDATNTVVGVIVVPFQNGITSVGTFLKAQADKFDTIASLQAENAGLQEQIDSLTTENTNLSQERYELQNLRELYALDSEYDQYEKTGAKIIAKDSGNWYHSFIIDKGTDDGLSVDMNVIAGSGLVGRISSVGSNWSKVETIIDDDSSTSGMILSTSDNLIVTGNLETYASGVIEFSKLVDDADRVTVGDKVVTSNISNKYLPGILIGYISAIESDSNNLTKSGQLTPAVDFEHLDEVLVILQTKQNVDESTVTTSDSIISGTASSNNDAGTSDSSDEASSSDSSEASSNNASGESTTN